MKRVATDLYWDGDSFDAGSETYFPATLGGGDWSFDFPAANFSADGSYTLHVRATDDAGNTESGPARTFTFDTTAPQTTIDSSPSNPTSSTSADFGFSASEGGSTYQCRLDGGAWGACTSPKNYAGLADGSHTFQVRATDQPGNTDVSPASFTWTVDTTAPNSTTNFPAASGEYNVAGWNAGCATSGLCGTYGDGAVGSGVDTVEVSIRRDSTGLYWNGASFSAGSETWANAALASGDWSRAFPASNFPADGAYTVRVRATDEAGNAQTPTSRTFTFDGTAPTGSLTAPADGAALRGASVAVSSDSADAGSGVASAEFQRRPAGGGAWTTIGTDANAPYSVNWNTTAPRRRRLRPARRHHRRRRQHLQLRHPHGHRRQHGSELRDARHAPRRRPQRPAAHRLGRGRGLGRRLPDLPLLRGHLLHPVHADRLQLARARATASRGRASPPTATSASSSASPTRRATRSTRRCRPCSSTTRTRPGR